jgi:hypothetical protein
MGSLVPPAEDRRLPKFSPIMVKAETLSPRALVIDLW